MQCRVLENTLLWVLSMWVSVIYMVDELALCLGIMQICYSLLYKVSGIRRNTLENIGSIFRDSGLYTCRLSYNLHIGVSDYP